MPASPKMLAHCLMSAVTVSNTGGPGCNRAARCTCCRYGIPFPVLARASFGVRGANLPALMRCAAQLDIGWIGASGAHSLCCRRRCASCWCGADVQHSSMLSESMCTNCTQTDILVSQALASASCELEAATSVHHCALLVMHDRWSPQCFQAVPSPCAGRLWHAGGLA